MSDSGSFVDGDCVGFGGGGDSCVSVGVDGHDNSDGVDSGSSCDYGGVGDEGSSSTGDGGSKCGKFVGVGEDGVISGNSGDGSVVLVM